MAEQTKHHLVLTEVHDGFEVILTAVDKPSVGWKKWYQSSSLITGDAKSLGFIESTTAVPAGYVLSEHHKLHEAVEIDSERLRRFAFKPVER